jgi:MFS family permease
VLAPLRLNALGAGPIFIGATFLAAAAVCAVTAPLVGRLADRRGKGRPVRLCLSVSVVVALLAPLVASAGGLAVVLVVALAAFGTIFVPAAAMISAGAERWGLHQGLAFGLSNLAWASGQGFGASSSGAIAQATSDLVPYALLAGACGVTLLAGGWAAGRLAARYGHVG